MSHACYNNHRPAVLKRHHCCNNHWYGKNNIHVAHHSWFLSIYLFFIFLIYMEASNDLQARTIRYEIKVFQPLHYSIFFPSMILHMCLTPKSRFWHTSPTIVALVGFSLWSSFLFLFPTHVVVNIFLVSSKAPIMPSLINRPSVTNLVSIFLIEIWWSSSPLIQVNPLGVELFVEEAFTWVGKRIIRQFIAINLSLKLPTTQGGHTWKSGIQKVYQVHEVYGLLSSLHHRPLKDLGNDVSNCLWHIQAQSKTLAFTWKVLLDKIQSRANFINRNISSGSAGSGCLICQLEIESSSHVLLTCGFDYQVWMKIYH